MWRGWAEICECLHRDFEPNSLLKPDLQDADFGEYCHGDDSDAMWHDADDGDDGMENDGTGNEANIDVNNCEDLWFIDVAIW